MKMLLQPLFIAYMLLAHLANASLKDTEVDARQRPGLK